MFRNVLVSQAKPHTVGKLKNQEMSSVNVCQQPRNRSKSDMPVTWRSCRRIEMCVSREKFPRLESNLNAPRSELYA